MSAAHRREWSLVTYSAGNFGKNTLLAGVDITLPFVLTDLIGVAPAAVSGLMLIVFLGDLVFDIGAGVIAAWARNRGVGYRAIIGMGAVPCCLAFIALYSLPALGLHHLAVLAATLLIFRATYALVDVPHNSLLAHVAADSRSRGRVSGYRFLFSSLAGLGIASWLAPAVVGVAQHGKAVELALFGALEAGFACLALWASAWPLQAGRETGEGRRRRGQVAALPRADALFVATAVVAGVTGVAAPMFGRMIIYLATYVYHRPALAGELLLAMTLGQFPGVALWLQLGRYAEKTDVLALSYALLAIGIGLFALAAPQPALLAALAALIGAALSGVFMLPWGIVADVVDFTEFQHGDRRETATFAMVLVIIKGGGAASVGLIGGVLGRLGYVPGVLQPPPVLRGMELLGFGAPMLGALIAIPVLMRMSVGHIAHARILRALQARGRPS